MNEKVRTGTTQAYEVRANDGAVYQVQAPEPSIVASMMLLSQTEGILFEIALNRQTRFTLACNTQDPTRFYSVLKEESWPLLNSVLESLEVKRLPDGEVAHPHSLDRLQLLTEEADRRVRSRRFDRLAAGCIN